MYRTRLKAEVRQSQVWYEMQKACYSFNYEMPGSEHTVVLMQIHLQ